MSTTVQSLIALALVWVFAYRRARMSTILGSMLLLLLAMTSYVALPGCRGYFLFWQPLPISLRICVSRG